MPPTHSSISTTARNRDFLRNVARHPISEDISVWEIPSLDWIRELTEVHHHQGQRFLKRGQLAFRAFGRLTLCPQSTDPSTLLNYACFRFLHMTDGLLEIGPACVSSHLSTELTRTHGHFRRGSIPSLAR